MFWEFLKSSSPCAGREDRHVDEPRQWHILQRTALCQIFTTRTNSVSLNENSSRAKRKEGYRKTQVNNQFFPWAQLLLARSPWSTQISKLVKIDTKKSKWWGLVFLVLMKSMQNLALQKPLLVYKHIFLWDLATKSLRRKGDLVRNSITTERASQKQDRQGSGAIRLVSDLCTHQLQTWLELRAHSPPSLGDKEAPTCPLTICCPKQLACGIASPERQLPGPKEFTNPDWKHSLILIANTGCKRGVTDCIIAAFLSVDIWKK